MERKEDDEKTTYRSSTQLTPSATSKLISRRRKPRHMGS